MRTKQLLSAILLSAVASACGSTLSQSKATNAQAAVRAAEEVGAPSLPKAALHLQLAKQEIADAQKLSQDGEGERANLVLDRAQVDAELAIQLAQTAREQQEAHEAWNKVQETRSETKVD